MAAIPTAGGASDAPRWVMRALLRVVVLVGMVAIGWLLGSGTSHADDDPGLPGTGLVPVVTAVSFDDASSGQLRVHPITGPTITRALSAVSVPPLPVQSPMKLGVLRPIVKAVGLPKPLVPAPVSRPLRGIAPQVSETRAAAPVEPLLEVPGVSRLATAVPTAALRTAMLTPAPAHHPASPLTLCSPNPAVVDPVIVQPTKASPTKASPTTDGPTTDSGVPDGPTPLNPPGSNASACLIGSAGGGGGAKSDPYLAAQISSATSDHTQPGDSASPQSSALPRSLSAQPSTSPD